MHARSTVGPMVVPISILTCETICTLTQASACHAIKLPVLITAEWDPQKLQALTWYWPY